MNRKQFLKELRHGLDALPFEERETAITYYEEYFDEAGPDKERETIESLGTPQEIAAGLRADYAVKLPPKTPKEGAIKVWMVILAIFAAPVAVPLAITVVAVIFSLFVAFASVVFAIGVTAFALLISGVAAIVGGIAVIGTSPLTTLFFLGSGAVVIGLGILFGYLTYIVATKLSGTFARLMQRLLNKVKERRKTV